jgi:PTH1 family peptidyl-tRNA hydrolase
MVHTMGSNEYLIAGLGNPGSEYQATRHNIGFIFLEELERYWNFFGEKEKWKSLYLTGNVDGCKIHLIRPMTFMNRSGDSVVQFYNFFKLHPERLLVIHDDLDTAPRRIPRDKGGGDGGHNGIRSIATRLGENGFYRLKIGIGRPGNGDIHPDFPVEKYVLSSFTANERELLEKRFSDLERGIRFFLSGDSQKAMGLLNSLK